MDDDPPLHRDSALARLADEIGRWEQHLAEAEQTIATATALLAALDDVAARLDDAGVWSTWDVYGGGIIATALKHRRLRHARRAAAVAEPLLTQLRDELGELATDDEVTGLLPQIDDGLEVDDYWPRLSAADLAVHERIVTSEHAIARLREAVMLARRSVQVRRRLISQELGSLGRERSRLLTDP